MSKKIFDEMSHIFLEPSRIAPFSFIQQSVFRRQQLPVWAGCLLQTPCFMI